MPREADIDLAIVTEIIRRIEAGEALKQEWLGAGAAPLSHDDRRRLRGAFIEVRQAMPRVACTAPKASWEIPPCWVPFLLQERSVTRAPARDYSEQRDRRALQGNREGNATAENQEASVGACPPKVREKSMKGSCVWGASWRGGRDDAGCLRRRGAQGGGRGGHRYAWVTQRDDDYRRKAASCSRPELRRRDQGRCLAIEAMVGAACRAIAGAETLIRNNGATSGVDRVHTALHGYLLAACREAGIAAGAGPTTVQLLKALVGGHPAFADLGPRSVLYFRSSLRVQNPSRTIRCAGCRTPYRNSGIAAALSTAAVGTIGTQDFATFRVDIWEVAGASIAITRTQENVSKMFPFCPNPT